MNGIRPGICGQVYAGMDAASCAVWVSFTRRQHAEIITIPFEMDESKMELGIDHSPFLTDLLHIKDDTSSFVYTGTIPWEVCDFDGIRIWQNTFALPKDELAKLLEMSQDE